MALRKHARETLFDGRFEILGPLGEGGFGTVYKAVDTWLGQEVALKVLTGSDDPKRFQQEVLLLRRLPKDQFVSVFDFVIEADASGALVLGYSMELFEDPWVTLDRHIKSLAKAPVARRLNLALRFTSDLLAAMATMHGHDVVHRDLKPANIWIDASAAKRAATTSWDEPHVPMVKIGDLGIAREFPSAYDSTATRIGTPAWSAPEQFDDKPELSARTDVHAAGLLLHFALTGKLLATGARGSKVAIKNELNETYGSTYLCDRLAHFVARATRYAASQRHASAARAGAELDDMFAPEVLECYPALLDLAPEGAKKNELAEHLFPVFARRFNWTNRSRGRLEVVKGYVEALHAQGMLARSGHRYRLA